MPLSNNLVKLKRLPQTKPGHQVITIIKSEKASFVSEHNFLKA